MNNGDPLPGPLRVVLDTNVLVSALIETRGASARIVAAWREGTIQVFISPMLLAELTRTLNYPRLQRRHGLGPEEITAIVQGVRAAATLVKPAHVLAVVSTDADDDHVIACAISGGAEFIVSGDRDLLELQEYRGIRILPPAAFVLLLRGDRA